MTRRIVSATCPLLRDDLWLIGVKVRTLIQLGALTLVILVTLFLLDHRYRVLPASIHSALPLHNPGTVITDITLKTCGSLNPLSQCRLDPNVWHRVEKDLYLNTGWLSSAYLHVKRKKEEELSRDEKVVIDVRVGRLDPGVGEKGQQNERWEARPAGIWLLRSSKRKDSDSKQVVTAVDVLFGADAVEPRPGWQIASTALLLDTDPAKGRHEVKLSVRHGRSRKEEDVAKTQVPPRIRKDGKFKMLQVSDLHLSTGVGVCRDPLFAEGMEKANGGAKCEADTRTLEFLAKVLDEEEPDLVVLSGDQVNGDTAGDAQSVRRSFSLTLSRLNSLHAFCLVETHVIRLLFFDADKRQDYDNFTNATQAIFKFAHLLSTHHPPIPYTAIFGNHDDETTHSLSLSRAQQMSLLQTLPYSLSQPGPESIPGVGNYVLEILAPTPSTHSALTLYFLDTHSYSPDEQKFRGYDWIKPAQIEWFREESRRRRGGREHKGYSKIRLDMAFIHIPLPEFAEKDNLVAGGQWREPATSPAFNSGFYDALAEEGILTVGCGHDHVNDYCALRPSSRSASSSSTSPPSQHPDTKLGPWMCYAGGSGFGGYAGWGGFHRRIRVWEVDTNAGRIATWKRVECCGEDVHKKLEELVVVEGGKTVPPQQGGE
ncbi:hypothetical protein LTR28_008796 [Elasticomyces elasticus]|nr:hypothetical protein LTR28_008796 [Elasticomyces elasticus]